MKRDILMYLFVVVLTALFPACSEKKDADQNPHELVGAPQEQPRVMPAPARVEVPSEILSAWKAIKVEVIEFSSANITTYTVDIGGEKEIGNSGLKIKALNFLPAFQMNVPIITSRSNELENPAAQIEVYEGDVKLFKGWLFTLYPTAYAFTHPKYSITLLGGIAAGK